MGVKFTEAQLAQVLQRQEMDREKRERKGIATRGEELEQPKKQKGKKKAKPSAKMQLTTIFEKIFDSEGLLKIIHREVKFDEERKWRFDYADEDLKIAFEIEGGVWGKSRHTSPIGYASDAEKYNSAALQGWIVLRYAHATQLLGGKGLLKYGRKRQVIECRGVVEDYKAAVRLRAEQKNPKVNQVVPSKIYQLMAEAGIEEVSVNEKLSTNGKPSHNTSTRRSYGN